MLEVVGRDDSVVVYNIEGSPLRSIIVYSKTTIYYIL